MERRAFLRSVAILPGASVLQKKSSSGSPRIDIHSHYYPPTYFERIRTTATSEYSFGTDEAGTTIIEYRGARFFGIQPPMTDAARRIEDMDRCGIDVQVVSLSVPNVFFAGEDDEPEIARLANDAYAELKARYPGRFLALASVPMSRPDAAVREIHRAIDELGLNGAILLSHVRGRPLTDPAFRPFFEEADRMGLFVLLHPMMPPGAADAYREYVLGPIVGFPCASTLAVARMAYDGLLRDFPRIRWLVPHLGGAIPFLMKRLDDGFRDFVACRAKIDEPPSTYIKRLYFGTVAASPYTLHMVRDIVGSDHIALGTDYPHLLGDIEGAVPAVEGLLIPEAEKERILGGTARAILNNV